jgi:hypothetical protein
MHLWTSGFPTGAKEQVANLRFVAFVCVTETAYFQYRLTTFDSTCLKFANFVPPQADAVGSRVRVHGKGDGLLRWIGKEDMAGRGAVSIFCGVEYVPAVLVAKNRKKSARGWPLSTVCILGLTHFAGVVGWVHTPPSACVYVWMCDPFFRLPR